MARCGHVCVFGRMADLFWFVFATALLLASFPPVSCTISGHLHPENLGKVRTRDPETNDVMIDPVRYGTGPIGRDISEFSHRELTGDTWGIKGSGAEPSTGRRTSRDPIPIHTGRKRRENLKLGSPEHPIGAHLPQRPWLGNGCARAKPVTNPTVVAGIVGGAIAFFLVVVLTIVYCSYRNHPPSDTRKRLAEMYAYMRGLEEVWVGVANTAITNEDAENAKYQQFEKMDKDYIMV